MLLSLVIYYSFTDSCPDEFASLFTDLCENQALIPVLVYLNIFFPKLDFFLHKMKAFKVITYCFALKNQYDCELPSAQARATNSCYSFN